MKLLASLQYTFLFLLLISLSFTDSLAQGFENSQLKFSRVRTAKADKEYKLQQKFAARNLPYPPTEVYFRAFKKEGVLEIWVKGWDGRFKKFDDYTSCASSGDLGPKRRQGDEQVPEGFYHISRFNPQSNYYLSLGINYPNQADRINSTHSRLGGSIYIHGSCKTIGCIPLTNEKIKEVYLLAVKAKNSGQGKIPIHIFPFKFNNFSYAQQEKSKRSYNYPLLSFWENLKQGYDYFENNKVVPRVSVNSDGSYAFY
ncbi:MAG: L,D-transpeptidase family protein [Chitinophagales bacterium]